MTFRILPTNPFWNFSIKVYRQPFVEACLLGLQEERGLNVNVILYCFWYSVIDQGRISKRDLRLILINIQPWHERIVLSLRRIRQKVKQTEHKGLSGLYQEVLNQELASEQIEQLIIFESFVLQPKSMRNHIQKIVDVCKNVATYCQLANLFLDRRDCENISQILQAIFPKIDQNSILSYCMEHLIMKELQSIKITAQFPLDL